ncbi:MAG: polysaccharide deacetylase family protein [Crocinitomicaceae bacterium]|nr:polysaccharide deacetylase family protein [Crocinitomicaceae bacterium]
MTRHHFNIIGFIINCTWIALFIKNPAMMWILLGLAGLLFLTFLTIGVVTPSNNYFLKQTTKLTTDKVLLTFDDGPDETLTPEILSILKKYDIGALFFVIGKKAEKNPQIIQQLIEEKHKIGNHTYNHPNLFALYRQDKVEKEIGLCDNVLIEQTIHPGNYFRPPIGYTNPRIARALKKFNKKSIGWSLRSYDTLLKEEDKLLYRLTSRIKPGDIVLLHDNLSLTATVLESFITISQKNGINFVTTKELNTILP